ncbi:MAG: hypothetical protein CMIDDMOC_00268 [Sodalis sp. Fle]|nr:MAG: hypothetical protein CMIDDMOC_00268 [Sodalis sp. Fle]
MVEIRELDSSIMTKVISVIPIFDIFKIKAVLFRTRLTFFCRIMFVVKRTGVFG